MILDPVFSYEERRFSWSLHEKVSSSILSPFANVGVLVDCFPFVNYGRRLIFKISSPVIANFFDGEKSKLQKRMNWLVDHVTSLQISEAYRKFFRDSQYK